VHGARHRDRTAHALRTSRRAREAGGADASHPARRFASVPPDARRGERGSGTGGSFELLVFFSIFSVLSIREHRAFWRSAPSLTLTLALGLGLIAIASLSLGMLGGLGVQPLSVAHLAFIVGAALVSCLGINDALKTSLLTTVAPVRVTNEHAPAG
jgi:hypothetical protein